MTRVGTLLSAVALVGLAGCTATGANRVQEAMSEQCYALWSDAKVARAALRRSFANVSTSEIGRAGPPSEGLIASRRAFRTWDRIRTAYDRAGCPKAFRPQ